MSEIDSLVELRKVIEKTTGQLTHEDAKQLASWERQIKTTNAYKNLAKNLAMKDILDKLVGHVRAAIEVINDPETPEDTRKMAFVMRDDRLWLISLFTDAEKMLPLIGGTLKEKIAEFENYRSGM